MKRMNVLAVVAMMFFTAVSLAATKSKSGAEKKAAKQVTVTLVRWPYT